MLSQQANPVLQSQAVAVPAPRLPRSKWDDAATVPPIPWRFHNWRMNWRLFFFGPRAGDPVSPFRPRED